MAIGKIYVHDCTPISALDVFLFGAEPQVLHAQHRVLIDTWIEMRISPRTAVLFKALRRQLSSLLARRIESSEARHAWVSSLGSARAPTPGGAGWPPPMETLEQAQAAILAALVWFIGRGVELQADELAAAALALGKGKANSSASRR